MVVFGRYEHLALAGQPAPWARVLHPVEITLEAQAERVGLLGDQPVARPPRPGGAGCELRIELGLALLTPLHGRTDERITVRDPDTDLPDTDLMEYGLIEHDSRVPGG
jgi:hypothetical protein